MRRTVLFLLLAILLLLAANACGNSGGDSEGDTGELLVTTIADMPQELKVALDELQNIQTSRADVTYIGSRSRYFTGTIEYRAPDQVRLVVEGTEPGHAGELLAIGQEFFFRIADAWFQPIFEPLPTPDVSVYEDDPFQVLIGGMTTVGGKRCQLYTFGVPPGPQPELVTSPTIQVCIADNRVQRLIWREGPEMFTATFQHDIPVEIKKPVATPIPVSTPAR